MAFRFHTLRRLKEDARLEKLAADRGYDSAAKMTYELYDGGASLHFLSELYQITQYMLVRKMKQWGIEIRSPGGPNNKKIFLTDDLVREVSRDGIPAVSARLGVTEHRLAEVMNEWKKHSGQK